jgi:hypothetical protein
VRSKFQNVTGRDLPCEVTCPCNDPAVNSLFAAAVAGEIPIEGCFTEPALGLLDGIVLFGSLPFAAAGLLGTEPPVYRCASLEGDLGPLTPAQGQLCADLLEQAAAAQSVPCVSPVG